MMNMLAIPSLQPDLDPFPHLVIDGLFPAASFAELAASFPHCPPGSGPTGYTLFRSDAAFEPALSERDAWRRLHRSVQSQAFVDSVTGRFRGELRQATCDLSQARYVDHVESRAEKESEAPLETALRPDELWVRFDIMQGRVGYSRSPHLDHRRRVATMLIYFSDSDDGNSDGGDLLLHDARDGPIRRTIMPRGNRAVLFPCSGRSWHSVSPVLRQAKPRNFVQISISSSVNVWGEPTHHRAGWLRALRGRLTAGATG